MENLSKVEQAIYDRAGGGEKGENAVMNYRDYIRWHNSFLQHERREFAKQRYLPRNEKRNGTNSILYDEYD